MTPDFKPHRQVPIASLAPRVDTTTAAEAKPGDSLIYLNTGALSDSEPFESGTTVEVVSIETRESGYITVQQMGNEQSIATEMLHSSAEAEAVLSESLEADATNIDTQAYRARVRILLGDYPAAEADSNEVLQQDPLSLPALHARSTIAKVFRDPTNEVATNATIAEVQSTPRNRYNYANALLRNNQPNEAVEQLELLIADTPEYLQSYALLSTIYKQHQRLDDSLNALERGLLQDPTNPDLLFNKASVLFDSGDDESAMNALNSAIEAAPSDAGLHLYKAQAQLHFGNTAEGKQGIRDALQINPSSQDAVFLGVQHADSLDDALAILEQAIQADPKNENFYLRTYQLLHQAGRLPAAVQALETGLSALPGNAHIIGALITVYRDSGQLAKALPLLKQSLEEGPSSAHLHMQHFTVCRSIGRTQEAHSAICNAISADPNNGRLFFFRAQILQELGRVPEALLDLDSAKHFDPSNTAEYDAYQQQIRPN